MPKNPKRRSQRSGSHRTGYIVAALVAVLAIGALGYYYLSANAGAATTTSNTSTSTSGCPTLTPTTSGDVLACVKTSQGNFEIELYPSQAPKTVANFVSLVKSGFYNNLVWHRIVQGFVIQTGDPNTRGGGGDRSLWGTGTSASTIPTEINSLHNTRGYLAMAKPSGGNGSSQWYINLVDNSANLDGPPSGPYTVFGQVVSGLGVVDQIAALPVNSSSQPVTASDALVISISIISGA